MDVFIFLALASTLTGCSSIYLGSPNQRWCALPWSAAPARCAGGALLATGLFAFEQSMQALTATLVFATSLMLMFVLLPYSGALVSARRNRS